jgi:hypothetical protein
MKSEEEGYVMTKVVKRSGNEVTVEVRIWLDGNLAGDGRGNPGGHQREVYCL